MERSKMYKLLLLLGNLYTSVIKRGFHSFGKHSIIKPILNTSNQQYISVGDNVNIGMFCRITVSTAFAGKECSSNNTVRIRVGNNVDIGNNTFISANNSIEIGDHVIMSSYVFITDHDHGFENINKNLHEQPLSENGYVKIGANVFLGEKCSVLKNVSIGEHSVVGCNCVVTKDVPRYSVVVGNPARVVRKYDSTSQKWLSV